MPPRQATPPPPRLSSHPLAAPARAARPRPAPHRQPASPQGGRRVVGGVVAGTTRAAGHLAVAGARGGAVGARVAGVPSFFGKREHRAFVCVCVRHPCPTLANAQVTHAHQAMVVQVVGGQAGAQVGRVRPRIGVTEKSNANSDLSRFFVKGGHPPPPLARLPVSLLLSLPGDTHGRALQPGPPEASAPPVQWNPQCARPWCRCARWRPPPA